jgi:hypothetical protein
MANEWYIQHGGKQYGPLTSANLKKLAAERKITPSTNVRLGTAGNWVPAARVQGLFAAASPAAASPTAQAPLKSAPPPIGVSLPPLDVPPAAPPMASPLARVPFGSVAPAPRVAEAETSIAPLIIGAVGLIFGILALATFWLPMLGGPMGWTGIGVGGLGLLLGIVGMVLSATQKGSGLYLNVAGTSSAAVGLVLSVVLGVTFGMFTSAPKPPPMVVVQKPILPPPVEVRQEPPPELPKEPQPALPPEPVWTDAGQPIPQGPIQAAIESVGIENIRLEGNDLSTLRAGKPQPMLKIRVTITNMTKDKIVEVPGWPGGGSLLGQGTDVSALLKGSKLLEGTEAGKTLDAASASGTLTDNVGNKYPQTPSLRVMGAAASISEYKALRPESTVQRELVFDPPLPTIEYLRLELSPAGFGGTEPLRFQIPKSMINTP